MHFPSKDVAGDASTIRFTAVNAGEPQDSNNSRHERSPEQFHQHGSSGRTTLSNEKQAPSKAYTEEAQTFSTGRGKLKAREGIEKTRANGEKTDEKAPPKPTSSRSPGKRKRSSSVGLDSPRARPRCPYIDAPHSPKRRMEMLDSGIGRDSPEFAGPAIEKERVFISSPYPERYTEPQPSRTDETIADLSGRNSPWLSEQPELYNTEARPADVSNQDEEHIDSSGSPPDSSALLEDRRNYSQSRSADLIADKSKRKRNFSNRTKTGCHTCRRRKKKCDETKPHCNNCIRGGFNCSGYGVKPPGNWANKPVLGKMPLAPQVREGGYMEPQKQYSSTPNPSLHEHYGDHYPPPESNRPRPTIGGNDEHGFSSCRPSLPPAPPAGWRKSTWNESGSRPYLTDHHPPTNYTDVPPFSELSRDAPPHQDSFTNRASTSTSTPNRTPAPPHNHGPLPSRSSIDSNRSAMTAQLALSHASASTRPQNPPPPPLSEKEKMLQGKPYRAFTDPELLADRDACKVLLERFNNASSSGIVSPEERARLFRAVIESRPTAHTSRNSPSEPSGSVGRDVVVEAPFKCDYGYNVHLGSAVVIQTGCVMLDPCEISIGDRVVIGPNVKFYGMTMHLDYNMRAGSRGDAYGASITIEDDVFIGGDVVILAGVKIGKGAVVGAGTVVSNQHVLVSGSPMRAMRGIDPRTEKEKYEARVRKTDSQGEQRHRGGFR
ncbi:hypothetical protein LTR28_007869 [Elasticomyces elasticus]|nr:hypothetical protein LTR28_007869 [Elasticomyces elasticus]